MKTEKACSPRTVLTRAPCVCWLPGQHVDHAHHQTRGQRSNPIKPAACESENAATNGASSSRQVCTTQSCMCCSASSAVFLEICGFMLLRVCAGRRQLRWWVVVVWCCLLLVSCCCPTTGEALCTSFHCYRSLHFILHFYTFLCFCRCTWRP